MLSDIDCDCVLVDNVQGAKFAVNQLLEHGHKKIGIITGPKDVYTAYERLIGYKEALMDYGLGIEESLISYGDYTIAGGTKGVRTLVENNPEMSAVFVANYEMTMGVIIEANELNLQIPNELSVIGFDNVEFSRACVPKLSIISQPTKEIAKKVSEIMLDRLENQELEADSLMIKLDTGYIQGTSIKRR